MSGDDNFVIHPSSSQDALDVLVSAEIEENAAERLLQLISGQGSGRTERVSVQSSGEQNNDDRVSFEARR